MENRVYLCIDLKSFYASVECVDRGLDSMTTDLVVADVSRGKGTICLAVSPSLKAKGVRNRCRYYEIPENLSFIAAKPRMKRYMEMSCYIYSIYLKYIAEEDIHIYSVDECFLDISDYLSFYNKSPKELAKMIIEDVYKSTGIRATAGIGTNLFLTKIALDITAKHSPDFIGYLDEIKFRESLWDHTPITDFWNISTGISTRLLKYGITTLRGITEIDEDILYKEFGIDAELLIDHAYGIETTTIKDIKSYKNKSNSFSNSQILFHDYSYDEAFTVFKEMVELNTFELINKGLVCDSISIYVGYSKDAIKPTGGVRRIGEFTNNSKTLMKVFTDLFIKTTSKQYPIRKLAISYGNVVDEIYKSYTLFTDEKEEEKNKKLAKAVLGIQNKFGKNAILRGTNLMEGATQKDRNKMIGGHNSGED